MILLRVVRGKTADREIRVRRFPCTLGRSSRSTHRLEGAGVWEEHFRLDLIAGEGFRLDSLPGAIVHLNGQPVQNARLRSGDVIEAGEARLQFWLGPVEQAGLRVREALVWLSLGGLVTAELVLALTLPQ